MQEWEERILETRKAKEDGLAEGEIKKVISQVCKKMQKGKPADQIADELEEELCFVEKIFQVVDDNNLDYDTDKIYDILYRNED